MEEGDHFFTLRRIRALKVKGERSLNLHFPCSLNSKVESARKKETGRKIGVYDSLSSGRIIVTAQPATTCHVPRQYQKLYLLISTTDLRFYWSKQRRLDAQFPSVLFLPVTATRNPRFQTEWIGASFRREHGKFLPITHEVSPYVRARSNEIKILKLCESASAYSSIHAQEAEGMCTGINKPVCTTSSLTTTANTTADRNATPSEHPTMDAPLLLWLASSGQASDWCFRFAAHGHEERCPRREGKNLRIGDKVWIPDYENNHQR